MYALLSALLVLSLSLLIVRIGTVALSMTGLSREVASLQSLSAYTGAGYTTQEAERAVEYPARRSVVKTLMRLGNVGLITGIASLVLSFADPVDRLSRFVVLLAAAGVIIALAKSRRFNDLVTPLIEWGLHKRSASFELRDYTNLLNLDRDYLVADLDVAQGEWLADERIGDLRLRSEEGVVILGIRRDDGTYIGAPGGEHEIRAGDTVIAYGKADRLQELVDRAKGDEAAHEEAKRAHRRTLALQRDIDPERGHETPAG